jgi:hypothetical protein
MGDNLIICLNFLVVLFQALLHDILLLIQFYSILFLLMWHILVNGLIELHC